MDHFSLSLLNPSNSAGVVAAVWEGISFSLVMVECPTPMHDAVGESANGQQHCPFSLIEPHDTLAWATAPPCHHCFANAHFIIGRFLPYLVARYLPESMGSGSEVALGMRLVSDIADTTSSNV